MAEKNKAASGLTPDRRPLTKLQAKRLAALADLNSQELEGRSAVELSEKFKWRVDPELFLFRRICGQVVKTDPDTGLQYPVPFATVHVEDTDCRLLGFFPPGWPWSWFFPLFCTREEIGAAVTDICGRFCIWVPRWEIDWILHWRHFHFCVDIFEPVNICDVHPEICDPLVEPDWIKHHFPDPGPGPWVRIIREKSGEDIAKRLMAAQMSRMAGKKFISKENAWNTTPFHSTLPPPLSPTLKDLHLREGAKAVAKSLPVEQRYLERLDINRYFGPFRRCLDFYLPEWHLFLDVPDITFRVTQDVNGDGAEEIIYSEGFSEVRWNAGPIPDVTLEASQIAIAGISCEVPAEVPCAEPAIVMAGLMPLPNPPAPALPYHNSATGYALRPNRPRPTGSSSAAPSDPAKTPFCWDLQLRGCNDRPEAKYYRINYSFEGSSPVTFKGLAWKQVRWIGSPGHLEVLDVVPDSAGWYEILNPAAGWMDPHLLLNWPTRSYQDGLYALMMEFAKPDKSAIGSPTSPVKMLVDNSLPRPAMDIRWRAGAGPWTNLGSICPIVSRHVGEDVEFEVKVQASLKHLRSLELRASGCGAEVPGLISALPAHWHSLNPPTDSRLEHWHIGVNDNGVNETFNFRLPSTAAPGVYSFYLIVYSRTFNPAGGDGGFTADWFYDPGYIWKDLYLPMAVINL